MDTLDGDEVRLASRGRYAERDIVQVGYLLSLIGAGVHISTGPRP